MAYETISVAPIAGALGAELGGVDLARELPDATIAEIRHALLTHLVIFLPRPASDAGGRTGGRVPDAARSAGLCGYSPFPGS